MESVSPVQVSPSYQKLGKRTLWLMLSGQMVTSVIFFIAAAVLLIAQENGAFSKTPIAAWSSYIVLGVWILFVLVFFVTFLVTYLNYANYLFMLDSDALKIRRGILGKVEIAIPYRQIQNVNIDQSFSDRLWGVARLAILTAGHEESKEDTSEGVLPAIDRALAESLQTELLRRADVQRTTAAA
jgi:uncharacterized membrane protein YdbT with pleckstrin-like domain